MEFAYMNFFMNIPGFKDVLVEKIEQVGIRVPSSWNGMAGVLY